MKDAELIQRELSAEEDKRAQAQNVVAVKDASARNGARSGASSPSIAR